LSSNYRLQSPAEKPKGDYAFVSLGCPKNTVDSERMLGLLQLDGYRLVQDPATADFVIVNTCGFIEQARTESFGAIDEMLELKQGDGPLRGVIVSGCLAERQKEQLLSDRPEIDSLVGVFGREEITQVADRLLGDLHEQRTIFQPAPVNTLPDTERFRITPGHFAYMKISEGCDRLCTFCAIPKMRGKHYSKPADEVIREATQLAEDGVRELIIVAQDTTYYGVDTHGETQLASLLESLNNVSGIDWIRLMYFYPMYVTDELLRTIADCDKIIPYVDIPLQHINDDMLRRMSRRVTRDETLSLLDRMRTAIPDLTLRTTFITGFPGETEAHVDELAEFIQTQRFQRVGVFSYSLEPDTPAALLDGHIEESEKEARRDRLMEIQQGIAFELTQARIGKPLEVILDAEVQGEQNVWVGRSKSDAPDVDSLVFVTGGDAPLSAGDIVRCEAVTAQGYDLIAVPIE
jgi:ribosomal protein S12 methylthiotransferase